MTRDKAEQILAAFRELDFELTPAVELLEAAFRIAMRHERTVYDSLYIALSEREKCVYITADEKLVNAVSKSFPKTAWVGNWSP